MNKTEAKRFACNLAARWIQCNIDGGCVWNEMSDADLERYENSGDLKRIENAMSEIIDELYRRGKAGLWVLKLTD